MKLSIILAIGLASAAHAQTQAAPPTEEMQEAVQALYSPQLDLAGFSAALATASRLDVPQQILVEAQVVRHVFREPSVKNAGPALNTLASILEIEGAFDPDISPAFSSKDEVRGVVSFGRALAAYENEDFQAMRKHVSDAFWFHPAQANIFGQLVTKYREDIAASKIQIDLQRPLTDSEGNPTTLAKQLEGKKALLIDFWASWCGPCLELMPDLKKKADYLKDFDVAVVGMNTDQTDGLRHAQRIREQHGFTTPWLCDSRTAPILLDTKIETIPLALVITPEGKILFAGHPEDPSLWKALRKVAGDLQPL